MTVCPLVELSDQCLLTLRGADAMPGLAIILKGPVKRNQVCA